MSSYVSNLVHFAWSTWSRRSWIDPPWQDDLYAYIGGIIRKRKGKLLRCGGMSDHIHIYASLPSTLSLAQAANAIKANSSRWVHEKIPGRRDFDWQDGYGAFTVSKSSEQRLLAYIDNQANHHRKRDYRQEFAALLERHGIEYDARYIWR